MLLTIKKPNNNLPNWPYFRSGVDRLFNDFLYQHDTVAPRSTKILRGDLLDEGDHLKLTAEIPGVSKSDLKISFLDNILTISGERKSTELPEESYWIKNERIYGKFLRTFKIPVEIDPKTISAEYHDGLLVLTLIKSEKAKPKEIEINIK